MRFAGFISMVHSQQKADAFHSGGMTTMTTMMLFFPALKIKLGRDEGEAKNLT